MTQPHDREAALIRAAAEVLVAMIAAAERDDRLALVEEVGKLLNAVLVHRDAGPRPRDRSQPPRLALAAAG